MRVFVVGATGVLGRNVVPLLLKRGHSVRALVRAPHAGPVGALAGAEYVEGDIFDGKALAAGARGCDAVLHLATAIPRRQPFDWSLNDRIRREGTRRLLDSAQSVGVRRYVQQSITFLYGDCGDVVVAESAPLRPDAVTQSAADMEAMVRDCALDWAILRGGSFYGPGTGTDEGWRIAARAGTLQLPGDGSAWVSLVRVEDMAAAVVMATEEAPAGSTYNIVDDEPVRYQDLYGYVAEVEGAAPPQIGGSQVRSLACSNHAARQNLGWVPRYSNYRAGLG